MHLLVLSRGGWQAIAFEEMLGCLLATRRRKLRIVNHAWLGHFLARAEMLLRVLSVAERKRFPSWSIITFESYLSVLW